MIRESTLSELIDGLDRMGGGDDTARRFVGVYHCQARQCLTRMSVAAPTLMMPLIGSKRIVVAEQSYIAAAGEYLVLPPGAGFDVENRPDPQRGRYLGAALVFDSQTVALFRHLYGSDQANWALTPKWQVQGTDELFSAVAEWVRRNHEFPADATQTRHRMMEILLLIARQGAAGNLLFQQQDSLRGRIKHLLALDPARGWRIEEVTKRLALSESTLRRQLRAEGVSFRDLLEDVRLDRGVDLVMTTDMPIGQIAFDCGYQSQSRFSERFRLRFSLSPTELRATQQQETGAVISLAQRRARR